MPSENPSLCDFLKISWSFLRISMFKSFLWAASMAIFLGCGARAAAEEGKGGAKLLDVQDRLKDDESYDKVMANSFFRSHRIKIKAGEAYKIEVQSEDFDTYLRLENKDGKQVAFNDDINKKNRNSRI